MVTNDFSWPCTVEKKNQGGRKKKSPTNYKSSANADVFLCLSYMPAPVLAVLENVRAVDWHGIKGCGWRGDGWKVGQGGRATILRFFRHHVCPTFLLISSRFSHSSQNRVPPFAWPPLTSCCFMLTTLTYTRTGWQTERTHWTSSPNLLWLVQPLLRNRCMKKIHKC